MKQNFQLVPKFSDNHMIILFVLPNGESRVIAQMCFPNDHQLGDNVKVAEEILPILRKRIKRSMD